jgi:hypothetical protein
MLCCPYMFLVPRPRTRKANATLMTAATASTIRLAACLAFPADCLFSNNVALDPSRVTSTFADDRRAVDHSRINRSRPS